MSKLIDFDAFVAHLEKVDVVLVKWGLEKSVVTYIGPIAEGCEDDPRIVIGTKRLDDDVIVDPDAAIRWGHEGYEIAGMSVVIIPMVKSQPPEPVPKVGFPFYPLSENQKQFIADAEAQGVAIDYDYSGRGMEGKRCPAVRLDDVADFHTDANYYTDSMGMGYVVYARS